MTSCDTSVKFEGVLLLNLLVKGKTYIKCSVMYGGGSQLDPRDSIADTTPLSIIEAQKELEEIDSEEGEDMPKPLDMTEEEVEAVSIQNI